MALQWLGLVQTRGGCQENTTTKETLKEEGLNQTRRAVSLHPAPRGLLDLHGSPSEERANEQEGWATGHSEIW